MVTGVGSGVGVALAVALAFGSPGFVPDVACPVALLGFGLDAGCAALHPASRVTDAAIVRRATAERRGRATMGLFLTSVSVMNAAPAAWGLASLRDEHARACLR